MINTFILVVCASVCALFLFVLLRPRLSYSTLRNVPGPSRGSLLFGNLDEIWQHEIGLTHRRWFEEHNSSVVRYSSLFGEQVLVLGDVAALNHVLRSNPYAWPKSSEIRTIISRLLGKGLIWAEGEDHKRMKRIMQPAFSPKALRKVVPVFQETAQRVREMWTDMIDRHESDDNVFGSRDARDAFAKHQKTEAVIDASSWMSRYTLDLIGLGESRALWSTSIC